MAIIKNAKAYSTELERNVKVLQEIDLQRQRLIAQGLSPDEISAALEPFVSRQQELGDQLRLYEQLVTGDLSGLEGLSQGQGLIAARIARRLSQKQLADLLDIDQAQLSRYETTEYRTAIGETLNRVTEVLGLRTVQLPNETQEQGVREGVCFEKIPAAPTMEIQIRSVHEIA